MNFFIPRIIDLVLSCCVVFLCLEILAMRKKIRYLLYRTHAISKRPKELRPELSFNLKKDSGRGTK